MFRMHSQRGFYGAAAALAVWMGGCPTDVPGVDDDADRSACRTARESFPSMTPATYAVVLEFYRGQQNGEQAVSYATIGTAFGVGPRLLATNGHVVDALFSQTQQPVRRVLAVQAGTGLVLELTQGVTHPEWMGDPLQNPDVGLLVTNADVPSVLTLAEDDQVSDLALGDELALNGFPGDVNEFIEVLPGRTVPQATALTGEISALRSFDTTVQTSAANTDSIQHQLPTSPGASGSPIVRCGVVAAVNNAGTIALVVKVDPQTGEPFADRVTAANNNFGIHVKHLRFLIALFNEGSLPAAALPPPFNPAPDGNGGNAGGNGGNGGNNGGETAALAGVYDGGVSDGAFAHVIAIEIGDDGQISGQSQWGTNIFNLSGPVQQDGSITFADDADTFGFAVGIYVGQRNADGTISGAYAENNVDNVVAQWGVAKR